MKLLVASLLFSSCLWGVTFTEDFSDISFYDSSESSAVWNLSSQRVHVPFVIDKDEDGDEDETLTLGDGSDGAFNSSRFSEFDENATSTLVTLSTSKTYQFTSFELPSGVTLKASGSGALIILVQGAVTVAGTIDLRGEAGDAGTAAVGTTPQGGASFASGGAGGNGGSSISAAADGGDSDAGSTTGGSAGAEDGGSSGGGGGGGMEDVISVAEAGDNGNSVPGGAGGAAGGSVSDTELSTLVGGGGGAGGAKFGGAASGGAGGGGGGAIKLFSGANLTVSGSILAGGGAGGAGVSGSGGGGGGAGGQVFLAAADLLTTGGTVNAIEGSGGTAAFPGGDGGDGGRGRTRMVDETAAGWFANPGSGVINPNPNVGEFGRIFPTLQSVVVVSKPVDTLNSGPVYASATAEATLARAGTVTLELAGSSDNFEDDVDGETGWVSTDSIDQLNGYRYFRFRLTLSAGDRASEPFVDSVTVEYNPRVESNFSFETASCARVHTGGRSTYPIGFVSLMAFLLSLPFWLKYPKTSQ